MIPRSITYINSLNKVKYWTYYFSLFLSSMVLDVLSRCLARTNFYVIWDRMRRFQSGDWKTETLGWSVMRFCNIYKYLLFRTRQQVKLVHLFVLKGPNFSLSHCFVPILSKCISMKGKSKIENSEITLCAKYGRVL